MNPAKQFNSRGESATAPFQFALSTRAGCECVSSGRQRRSMTGQPLCLWTALGHTIRSPVTACWKDPTEWLTETR